MNRLPGRTGLLFLLIVAGSVILRPLLGSFGAETLAHDSLLNPKAAAALFGTPARSLAAAHRLDKGEKENLLNGLALTTVKTRVAGPVDGSFFPCLTAEAFAPSQGLVL